MPYVNTNLIIFSHFIKGTWDDQEINANTNTIAIENTEAGFFEKLGAQTEVSLEQFFRKWGTKCASHPGFVLFIGFCFVVTLGHGVKDLKVTTDPVELWAAPHSQARVEREYFDSHFNPFYRIEQIIIKAENLSRFNYTVETGEVVEFGPIFHKEFLWALYDLEQSIKGKLYNNYYY